MSILKAKTHEKYSSSNWQFDNDILIADWKKNIRPEMMDKEPSFTKCRQKDEMKMTFDKIQN